MERANTWRPPRLGGWPLFGKPGFAPNGDREEYRLFHLKQEVQRRCMSSTQYTKVSCGFHTFADGSVWAVQDFK